jgi:hypothetical protein
VLDGDEDFRRLVTESNNFCVTYLSIAEESERDNEVLGRIQSLGNSHKLHPVPTRQRPSACAYPALSQIDLIYHRSDALCRGMCGQLTIKSKFLHETSGKNYTRILGIAIGLVGCNGIGQHTA